MRYVIFYFFFVIFFACNALAEIAGYDEAKAYAVFIQKMANSAETEKNKIFCIVGGDEVSKFFVNDNIDVNPKKYDHCKVVYLAQDIKKIFRIEVDKFNKKRIPTIAVFDNFVEGGGTFRVELGRRDFEITMNSKTAKDFSVKLNSTFVTLVIN
ncbi:MAG: hypothetical protein A2887_05825 [Alphaproteobacteria bacterium RIFCSPLOWO2_01_FULL_40_26]|nr:MAG: hypothetical protein A3D15_02085 [Alphaproteobacteria bacterium RIFCSPHIGHO2_02_FULL_40_34]OFW94246.1 MAG: hypothetical protein A2887_05825 [Alphaproteobacteria bacterium RIFCSPLOWO2_01_FULL_40_26]OFX09815.1 MAG: hypothetical protein A3H30_00585 [Alphaproteobacteria bacterium RIFCSPLOWO2_02_FULL_40_19]OFX11659.1 MAG: hypothetical protein A3G22_03945 [Alphaproteobacteria bacterium RIFCSPLOWO2_12_FULL_40_11]